MQQVTSGAGAPSVQSKLLARDVREGFSMWRAWSALALFDIKHRYKRSVLGPLWITISMTVLILGVGLLYAKLFKVDVAEYLPYIALGDIVWIYISTTVQDGCTCFTSAENLIRSMRIPVTLHIMRTALRNFLVFLHGAIAYVPFAMYFEYQPQSVWLLALLGIALLALASVPVIALLGVLAARFRDIQPAVANVMQLVFFLSPVIWKAQMLGEARWIADMNPLYHFIQVVREPLMGQAPSLFSWSMVIGTTLVFYCAAWPVLVVGRRRISFWV